MGQDGPEEGGMSCGLGWRFERQPVSGPKSRPGSGPDRLGLPLEKGTGERNAAFLREEVGESDGWERDDGTSAYELSMQRFVGEEGQEIELLTAGGGGDERRGDGGDEREQRAARTAI